MSSTSFFLDYFSNKMMFFDRYSIFFSVSILREYADSTMCCCQCRVEFVEIRPVREVALLFT